MSKFVVEGGRKLQGEVYVQGSKNAAFPVLAACLLAEGPCEIANVPDIVDVRIFLRIAEALGAKVSFKNHRVAIDGMGLQNRPLPKALVGKLRGSIVYAGALLGRFHKVVMPYPGGDAIGGRPIDVHLDGFRKLGARVRESKTGVVVETDGLRGSRVVLGIPSVTGTENLILIAAKAKGFTEIRLAATEPHVQNLCRFLKALGVQIAGLGTTTLKVKGASRLRGAKFALCPDEIEAVTFCMAAAASRGEVTVKGADLSVLDAPLFAMERMGVNFETGRNAIRIRPPQAAYRATKIVTGVYPQLLTDEQPLFGVLATQAQGETTIHDWIYEGRQGYLKALRQMGASVAFDDVHRARIKGPTLLAGAKIAAPDIRAGASILIAALVAKGRSNLYNAEIIDRGYERLDERLNALGANIRRVE